MQFKSNMFDLGIFALEMRGNRPLFKGSIGTLKSQFFAFLALLLGADGMF